MQPPAKACGFVCDERRSRPTVNRYGALLTHGTNTFTGERTKIVAPLPAVAKTGAWFVERSERWRLVFDSPNPVSGLNFESLAQGFENLAGIVDAIPADSRAQCFHPRLLELKRRCERLAYLGGHRHQSGANEVGISGRQSMPSSTISLDRKRARLNSSH